MTDEAARWEAALHAALDGAAAPGPRRILGVRVVETTPSTQDDARGLPVGHVVVGLRQSDGRGRFGRRWDDTGAEGIALTAVLAADDAAASRRLALAAAVAAATAAQAWLEPGIVGIKWPNDVLAGGRKLAGVLVERCGDRALVGIGLNVNQTRWPEALAARAVSLRAAAGDEGAAALPRIDVAAALLVELDRTLAMAPGELAARFATLDVLTGRRVRVRCGEAGGWCERTGVVRRIDPFRGLELEGRDGRASWLEADRTTLLAVEAG